MEKIVFFLAENANLTATEKEFINDLNQVLLIYDDLKNDLFNKNEQLLDFDIVRSLFDYSFNQPALQFEFTNDLIIKSGLSFDTTKKIIPTHNSPDTINMGVDDFRAFIQDNNISTIFVTTKVTGYDDLFLNEDLGNFYSTQDEQLICDILQKHVKIYNNILKKLNLDAVTQEKYFCLLNNFAFGCIEKQHTYFLDKNHILSAIAIMCKDEINKTLIEFEKIQKQKKKETARLTEVKIQKLKERILNDENFASCKLERERLLYLKTALKSESIDVIDYLEMELTSTGTIRRKGLNGTRFINELWEQLTTMQ